MRNWNPSGPAFGFRARWRFDRTYEELKHSCRSLRRRDNPVVLIVPMRNWNSNVGSTTTGGSFGFDRTYEELKHESEQGLILIELVLIVPMRNWNWDVKGANEPWRLFWSYLWGIETCLPPASRGSSPRFWSYLWGIETSFSGFIYRSFLFIVLIVPMRNWNIVPTLEAHKLAEFWSYLWGIETPEVRRRLRGGMDRFDRTYEELKPHQNYTPSNHVDFRFDRTYEELKPIRNIILRHCVRSFDRTYEELKLFLSPAPVQSVAHCFDRTYEELKPTYTRGMPTFRTQFWSYLWGIETRKPATACKARLMFWSYLWGIETYNQNSIRNAKDGFDRTYEELKRRLIGIAAVRDIVLIVPMRNWNSLPFRMDGRRTLVLIVPMRNWNEGIRNVATALATVLIVPMRNWNANTTGVDYSGEQGFDRTYEELKPLPSWCLPRFRPRFDRTYEELKLQRVRHTIQHPAQSFDRTYEELKLFYRFQPVRRRRKFWSYLWGIETTMCWRMCSFTSRFWSYLWGIETPLF